MPLGPIEVLVVEFPGSKFTGAIIPELERLIEAETITVIDGLFLQRGEDDSVTFVEFEELGAGHDAAALAALLRQVESLISDEDVAEIAESLQPGSAAAVLVFEHTWAKGFQEAIVNSGGILAANLRIPGPAVDELLAELAQAD